MKLILRMIPIVLGAGLLVTAPAQARNYDCTKAGNANKAFCKTAPAAPAPAAAPAAKPAATTTRHYDCSKAGNANKVVCKGSAPLAPAAAPAPLPPRPMAPTGPAAPAAARAPASRAAAPTTINAGGPNGATAMCTDGTYSHSAHRSGTCSRHGGVKSWY
ncbi:MAG: hypothetical protein JWO65_384 [Sphingomonas bacterium]|nr:hypothetical protein [Sphingomonas bacterium]